MQFIANFVAIAILATPILATPTPVPTISPIPTVHNAYPIIELTLTTSPGLTQPPTTIQKKICLNRLNLCHLSSVASDTKPCSVSGISITNATLPAPKEVGGRIGPTDVECRGYRDTEGLVPGSATFRVGKPAAISTNLGTIGSILCYVVAA
ncbi:hypothetical protein BGZ60DRAFT_417333 [Tricladium varicosporioides]|nr:hypothetical protein BGZ60DRAFT_417333 [Hymenoscyphus varicosporioides]